jgi:hypothetical protein
VHDLNNDALLDCVVVQKAAGEHAAFAFIVKVHPGEQQATSAATLARLRDNAQVCCACHTIYAALVRREDADVGRLVKLARRSRARRRATRYCSC